MAAGALFLSLSIAPTEEVTLIAVRLTSGQVAALAALSVVLMHAFVYAVECHGQASRPESSTAAGEFVRVTVVGYALSLLVSVYVLWTFGDFAGLHYTETLHAAVVLGFPAAIGAAAARLIL